MYNRRRFTGLALGSTAVALISGPLQAAARRAPDLTITAFEWSPLGADQWGAGAIEEDASIVFRATVRNDGAATIPNKLTEVTFLIDGDIADNAGQISALAPGEELTLTGTQPWSTPVAGSYPVAARVVLGSGEVSTANNSRFATLEVVAPGMAALAAPGEMETCPITDDLRKAAKIEKADADFPDWRDRIKVKMREHLVKAHGKSLLEADMLAATAVAEATNLSGLAAFAATIAGIVGAAAIPGGGFVLGVTSSFVLQAVDMALRPGEIGQSAMVGYSTGAGGNSGGLFPTPFNNLVASQIPGTTVARAEAAFQTWGVSPAFKDPTGDFGSAQIFGSGGKIVRYKNKSAWLKAIFYMFLATMRWADWWNLGLWTMNFVSNTGAALAPGGWSNPVDGGGPGGLYYGEPLSWWAHGRSTMNDATLRDETYVAALHGGVRNIVTRTGIHGNILLPTHHHKTTLGVPTNLQPTATNGEFKGNGLGKFVHYTRETRLLIAGSNTADWIDTCCALAKGNASSGIALPTIAALVWRVLQAFRANGWAVDALVDDVLPWLISRGAQGLTRAGVLDMIADIMAGAMITPGGRRWAVNMYLSLMDTGAFGRPNLIVQNQVYQATGTGSFSNAEPPTVAEYNQVANIYSKWRRGAIPVGRTIRVNTTTGAIEHT